MLACVSLTACMPPASHHLATFQGQELKASLSQPVVRTTLYYFSTVLPLTGGLSHFTFHGVQEL